MRSLHRSRRSRWWFALIVVPALLGTLGVVHAARRLSATFDAMVRVDMPGTHEVELPAGDLTIYDEGAAGSMSCALRDADTGAAVELKHPSSSTTYHWGSRSGESVAEFTSPHAGRYVMACTTDDSAARHTLAIGGGLGWPIVGLVLAAIGGMLGVGLTAVGVWLWRRRSAATTPAI